MYPWPDKPTRVPKAYLWASIDPLFVVIWLNKNYLEYGGYYRANLQLND